MRLQQQQATVLLLQQPQLSDVEPAAQPDIIAPVPVPGPVAAAPSAKHQRRRNTPFHPPPPKPALKAQMQPVDKPQHAVAMINPRLSTPHPISHQTSRRCGELGGN